MSRRTINRELRLVESADGWAVVHRERNRGAYWAAGFTALLMASVVALGPTSLDSLIAPVIASGVLGGIALFPMWRSRRIQLKAHGIELGWLYSRGEPSIELSHTDYSLWFDLGEERVEVMLEQASREDIARVHDEIASVWKRFREGMRDTEAEAQARRAQLGALQKQ